MASNTTGAPRWHTVLSTPLAVGRNPLCVLVPCHRVVGAGKKLTGYAGGLARKRFLLELEQVVQPPLMLPAVINESGDHHQRRRAVRAVETR